MRWPFIVVGFLTSMFSVMSWQISKWPNSAAIWKCVIPYLSLGILLSILLIMFTNAQLTWNGVPSFVCSILFYYWLNFCHPTLQRCLESILKISASWCLIIVLLYMNLNKMLVAKWNGVSPALSCWLSHYKNAKNKNGLLPLHLATKKFKIVLILLC